MIKKPICLYDGHSKELAYPTDQTPLTDHTLDEHTDVSAASPYEGQRLAWDEAGQLWVPRTSNSALGLMKLHYRFELPPTTNPASGHVSRDSTDPTLATLIYINELDRDGVDSSQFWNEIKAGDWFNIYRSNDPSRHESYDVIGPAVDNGGSWAVPVAYYLAAGATLTNNSDVQVIWRIGANYPHDVLVDRNAADSHPATAISFDNTGNGAVATETQGAIEERMSWKGRWSARQHYKNEVCTEGVYLGIAIVDTTDNLEPWPLDTPVWTAPDAPTWSGEGASEVIRSGLVLNNVTTSSFKVTKIRVWIPDLSADAHYKIAVYDNLTDRFEIGEAFDGSLLSSVGWYELVTSSTWIHPGDSYTFYLIAQNSSTATAFNYPWTWDGNSNQDNNPGTGLANRRNDHSELRINKTDDDGTDRSTELLTVVIGTVIRIESEGNASEFLEYEVVGDVTNNAGWVNYIVALVETGASGEPNDNARCSLHFSIPVIALTSYVSLSNHYAASLTLQGIVKIGDAGYITNSNSYGVDIEVQEFVKSPDWEIMAVSS